MSSPPTTASASRSGPSWSAEAKYRRRHGAHGDRQWIHTDPERAKGGTFGGTIAHGHLTVPVPVGSRIRGGAELVTVDEVPGGVQATVLITVEIEGGVKPACVIESISRSLT